MNWIKNWYKKMYW